MTWPTAPDKTHYDEATDDPKQARGQFVSLRDAFATLLSHFPSFMQTFVGSADAATARSNLDVQQLINSLTVETAPATGDLIGLRDISASADRKMTLQNMLKVINLLTEDTSPSGANDFIVTYDASAALPKKVKVGNIFAPAFESAEQTVANSTVLNVAHGLGAVPSLVQVSLRCKTSEHGYSVNEEICQWTGELSASGDNGATVSKGSTNVVIVQSSGNLIITSKSTFAPVQITNANWRWVVRAW